MNSSLHDAGQARKSFRAASSASATSDVATSVDTPANQVSVLITLFHAAKLDVAVATPAELLVAEYRSDCDDVVGAMLLAAADDLSMLAASLRESGDAQSERILDRISNRLLAATELRRRQIAVAS